MLKEFLSSNVVWITQIAVLLLASLLCFLAGLTRLRFIRQSMENQRRAEIGSSIARHESAGVR